MGRSFRHWKQRFDPNAEFVFTRRVRVGPKDAPWVPAGTVVDKVLHKRRLVTWWWAGLIAIKDWTPEKGRAIDRARQERRLGIQPPEPTPPATPPKQPQRSSSNRRGGV